MVTGGGAGPGCPSSWLRSLCQPVGAVPPCLLLGEPGELDHPRIGSSGHTNNGALAVEGRLALETAASDLPGAGLAGLAGGRRVDGRAGVSARASWGPAGLARGADDPGPTPGRPAPAG